jgi:hypothetical protein
MEIDFCSLARAIHVLRVLHSRRSKDLPRIGFATADACSYRTGEALFYEEYRPGICTIEAPMNAEWIARNELEGSLITTIKTTVGVPLSFVDSLK